MDQIPFFHEVTLWSGYRAVISFVLTKQIFLHFYRHGNQFYDRYLNSVDKKKYIDDDGSGEKQKLEFERRLLKYSCWDPIHTMFDRDRKEARQIFGKKRKATRCIFLPRTGLREAEGNLKMRSCLQDDVINFSPRIVKYINKLELYRQFPPRRVKNSHISEIENSSCVRNVMNVTPVSGIDRVPWGAAIILRTVNEGVYICPCNVKSVEYNLWTKHAFFYDSNYKHLHQTKFCGVLIENIADAPICVLEYKYR